MRALLARARADELELLERLRRDNAGAGLPQALAVIWEWLADPAHGELLALWLEGHAQGVADPAGPWAGFAEQTVNDWLAVLEQFQAPGERRSAEGATRRALALAVLRGAVLDLLASGDVARTGAVLPRQIELLEAA